MPRDPSCASRARHLVAKTLHDWDLPTLVEPATMIATELVTNALRHAQGPISLSLRISNGLLIRVIDGSSATRPRVSPLREEESDRGRGLVVVDSLADAWGVQLLPHGKAVWARLDLPAELAPFDSTSPPGAERFEALLAHTSDIIAVLEDDGTIRYANPAAANLMALEGDITGTNGFDLVHPEDRERAMAFFSERLESPGVGRPIEVRVFFGDGMWHTVEVVVNNLLDDEAVHGVVLTIHDVTERLAEQATLRDSEARLRSLVEHLSDAIVVLNEGLEVTWVSPAIEQIIGAPEDTNIGMSAFNDIHPGDIEQVSSLLLQLRDTPGETASIELRLQNLQTGWRWIEATAVNRLLDPNVNGIVCTLRDVTERKAFEEQLQFQAHHDPLTGLPNRSLFLERLAESLEALDRQTTGLAVLFFDLDRFKVVNDSLGHEAGDELLVIMADRLRGAIRAGDVVARFGGDEFTVLCRNVVRLETVVTVADRIARIMGEPCAIGDEEVVLRISGGIAMATSSDATPESLLRDADAAMYHAKARGRAHFEVFDETLRRDAVRRLDTEVALRRALECGGLDVHYQPLLTLADRRIIGVEALVRWTDADLGPVAPIELLAVAEETGLVIPLGVQILEQAVGQLAWWDAHGHVPLTMAVNLSARQLGAAGLAQEVRRIISKAGIDPARLHLEITESAVMEDMDAVHASLAALRSLGVKLAIDDFGTGYSSLAHLHRFPVDQLKIDRAFIDGLGRNPEDSAIVAAIVSLALTLGFTSVAEGVETDLQLAELRTLGCDQGQGFLFASPGTADDIAALLDVQSTG
ncbi:MAG TPA: EAL domain-containing protein [Acidimicrobiales bacterium]|nr:EAL domain-containing protein [Acidimicrobiales bacterium]